LQRCALCAREHELVNQRVAKTGETYYERCFAGMIDVAVPVIVDGEHVATLFAGQVFLRKPDAERFRSVVRQLCRRDIETDLASLREAYFHSRVIAEEEF